MGTKTVPCDNRCLEIGTPIITGAMEFVQVLYTGCSCNACANVYAATTNFGWNSKVAIYEV